MRILVRSSNCQRISKEFGEGCFVDGTSWTSPLWDHVSLIGRRSQGVPQILTVHHLFDEIQWRIKIVIARFIADSRVGFDNRVQLDGRVDFGCQNPTLLVA